MIEKKMDRRLIYFIVLVLSLIVEFCVFHNHGWSIYLPGDYTGDYLLTAANVKTIVDTGWYLTNPYLSAPGIFNQADFAFCDGASMVILYLLSLFLHNYLVVINVFYFATFPALALVSFYAFSKLGIKPFFATAAALLYTFQPYHLFRNEGHFFLSTIYAVPIFILFAVDVFQGKSFFQQSKLTQCLKIAGLIFATSSGVYYAFFGMFFIFIAGLYSYVRKQQKASLPYMLIGCCLIVVTVGVNISPSIYYHVKYGSNPLVGQRDPAESEVAGLKIAQMVFPVENHRLTVFRDFKRIYNDRSPLVNENNTASLGILGSIGFFMLLWLFFMRRSETLPPNIELFSLLNLLAVLLATIGGLGTLFSYLVTPEIRSYNRISVYIDFFCLYTLLYYCQYFFTIHASQIKRFIAYTFIAIIIILGLIDQTPIGGILPNYKILKTLITKDSIYINQLEKILPRGSKIFQLPYSAFPEGATVVNLGVYEQFKPYMVSMDNYFKWSYGSMTGRPIAIWQEKVASLPVKSMVDALILSDFSGILINTNGYKDNAKALTMQLDQLLHEKGIYSQDKDKVFYNLLPYKTRFEKNLTPYELQEKLIAMYINTNFAITWSKGFYQEEKDNRNDWHWSKKNSIIKIDLHNDKPINVVIDFTIKTGYPTFSNVTITSDIVNDKLLVNNQGIPIHKIVTITPGEHNLVFSTDAKRINSGSDRRRLYFRVDNFIMKLAKQNEN